MRKYEKKSLSKVVTLITVVWISLAIFIVSTLFIVSAKNTLLDNLKQKAEITIESLASSVYGNLSQSVEMANNAAKVAETVTEPSLLKEILAGLLNTNENAFELYYGKNQSRYEPDSYFVAGSGWDPALPWNQIERPWFKTGVEQSGKTAITEPYLDSQTGKMCITIVRSANSPSGEVLGVAGVDMFIDKLTEIAENTKITDNSKTYILTTDGIYVTNENHDLVGTKIDSSSELFTIVKKLKNENQTVAFIGKVYFCTYQIAGTNWELISFGPCHRGSSHTQSSIDIPTILISRLLIMRIHLYIQYLWLHCC